MHFLWVTKEIPFGANTGARIYSNGLIRGLLATGTTGTLVAYRIKGDQISTPSGITLRLADAPRRWRPFSLLSSLQSDAYCLKGPVLARQIQISLKERPTAIVIDYFAVAWTLPIIRSHCRNAEVRPTIVYITHNYEPAVRRQVAQSAENPLMRQLLKIDAEKAARLDLAMLHAADLVVTNTADDKDAYQKHVPNTPILVLTPAYDGEIKPTRPINDNLPRRAVIAGAFEWIAKQLTLRRFLKAAERHFPAAGIELLVVGRTPPELMKELSLKYPFCVFTGAVENIQPYLQDARIGIMPDDVGGGFKHKYLYYIFAGLPIATIRSQFSGLPLDAERDVFACESVDELAQAVTRQMDNVALLNSMQKRCWETCVRAFGWADRGTQLREAIEPLLERRPMLRGLKGE